MLWLLPTVDTFPKPERFGAPILPLIPWILLTEDMFPKLDLIWSVVVLVKMGARVLTERARLIFE